MAVSKYPIKQYTSAHLVASASAMLFCLPTGQVALCTTSQRLNGYYQRAAVSAEESRREAALHAKPERRQGIVAMSTPSLSMTTRTPRPDNQRIRQTLHAISSIRTNQPFVVTIRELSVGEDINLTFWCIAWVSEKAVDGGSCGGLAFRP